MAGLCCMGYWRGIVLAWGMVGVSVCCVSLTKAFSLTKA